MAKSGPLGKAEKYFIEGHFQELTVDKIAKELDRAKSVVKRHITKIKKERAEKEMLGSASTIPSSNGSTVMTQGGSEHGDKVRRTGSVMSAKLANSVTGTRSG